MRPIRAPTWLAALAAATALAAAPAARAGGGPGACYRALDARGVAWTHASRPGIDLGVEVEGPLGGVTYQAFSGRPLVLDCSLVVSLAEAGPYFVALGIDRVTFSSAYQVRDVRGTHRRSKHSFGLAIDVHTFHGPELGTVNVERDFEQGLGDAADCVGQPLTRAARCSSGSSASSSPAACSTSCSTPTTTPTTTTTSTCRPGAGATASSSTPIAPPCT